MGESLYLTYAARQFQHPQDLTPYSAVSSFNLPALYDSSLITPVSSTQSPMTSTKSAAIVCKEREIKLSPSIVSPNYHFLGGDEDYGNGRYNNTSPMKHKDPSGTLHISTADSSFPVSPFICSSPYWGAFGVSATPGSRISESSLSMNPNSSMNSAGGLSNSSRHSRQQTPAQSTSSYGSQNRAPILIAPNPASFRPANRPDGGPYRQNSLQSISTAPRSATLAPEPFAETLGPLPARRKRKSPSSTSNDQDIVLSGPTTAEEKVLLELSAKQELSWKEVTEKFNEQTGKSMKVAALQMRKKRMMEKLRIWTDGDERALTLAVEESDKSKWETISANMLKYGCVSKWTKRQCQRKWHELNSDDNPYTDQHDRVLQYQSSTGFYTDDRAWSDGGGSVSLSLQDGDTETLLSAISTTTMDEVRSRAENDASSQRHRQQQQHHHPQLMFEQRRNRSGWPPHA